MSLVIDITAVKRIQNTSGLWNAWGASTPAVYDVISASHGETKLLTLLCLSMYLSIGTTLVHGGDTKPGKGEINFWTWEEDKGSRWRDVRTPFCISDLYVTPSEESVMQGLVCEATPNVTRKKDIVRPNRFATIISRDKWITPTTIV